MVEVFRTNVSEPCEALAVIAALDSCFPGLIMNFDLGDCDRILRVEGDAIHSNRIVDMMISQGFCCSVLE